jgi:hypothetical protein
MLAVKSYFDGSEIPGKTLTLAAIGADETTWGEMEARWEEVRKTRSNPARIHMTDLMAIPPQGIYEGWSVDQRDYLVDGLLNVLLSFRGHPSVFSFTCSIKLADYETVRLEKKLPAPERMCARFVFPHVMRWYIELPRVDLGKMEVYFDRSEKFMRHIEPDWRSKEIRKRHPQWDLVSSIGQAVMEKTPALQMTDVVAWGRNRITGGSHWETDPHYATAVRACGSLYSIHRPIDKDGLRGFRYREEGFAAIDPQRKDRAEAMFRMHASEEFKRFDKMMRELMRTSHMDLKTKPDEEKAAKKRKKSRKSSASHEGV